MALETTSLSETKTAMKASLSGLLPEFEISAKAELVYEINQLKKERGAIILGHNYMEPTLYHCVADVVGDSLELARAAERAEADPIVFCGVRFMAETAKILNPNRTVLLPAKRAGCSLAESITAKDVRELRERFPGVPIVAYVNTYADVKAEVDICCTSSNAALIVKALKDETVIFLPDEFLAQNVAEETGKKIILAGRSKGELSIDEIDGAPEVVGWRGRCEVHDQFTVEDINSARAQHPEVTVLSHPECSPEVVAASDFSGSTSRMIDYVKTSPDKKFLMLTECSMGDNIMAENPEKEMLRMCSVRCPHMAEITLEDTILALRENKQVIEVPEEVRVRAKKSLDRMLEYG